MRSKLRENLKDETYFSIDKEIIFYNIQKCKIL